MVALSNLIREQLRGPTVRAARRAKFDFASGPGRLWAGFGDLVVGGETYLGFAGLGQMSPVSVGSGGAVEEMEFALAANDAEIFARIEEDSQQSIGREVQVFQQFFDVRKTDEAGNWVDWLPIDFSICIFTGFMGPLRPQRSPGDGGALRILRMTASNAFLNRSRPPYAFCTDRDQQARHPGDNIFINVAEVEKQIPWPRFS